MKNKQNINILKGMAAFAIYFLISQFATIPLELLKVDIKSLSKAAVYIYEITIYIIIILLIALLFKDYIINSLKDMKKNKDIYFKKYFKYWFYLIGLVMLSNAIILIIGGGKTANNQDIINELTKNSPLYAFILAVIFAPITEEFAFRLSFKNMFKDKTLFILASGLVFGAFHVIPLYTNWVDLLYLIPYSIPGFFFAYILSDSDNIFVPISMHMFHNGLILSIQILAMLIS